MIENLNESISSPVKTEVCIVGAGPAGIVLALTLAELGVSSVLLEGGLLDSPLDLATDPYDGRVTGVPYPLKGSRLRYFGGTSNHWGGWCKPLDDIDFTRRSTADLPSWPLTLEELRPAYENAARWCEIGPPDFNAVSVLGPDNPVTFPEGNEFKTRLFRFSPPTRFGTRYRTDIAENDRIRCFYDATLCALEFDGKSITKAVAASSNRTEMTIEADRYVFAMGGIENARFLLHFNRKHGLKLGDQSDFLGKCFMDHFGFHPGYLAAGSELKLLRQEDGEGFLMPVVTARPELQEDMDLPNICVAARPDAPDHVLPPAYFENPGLLDDASGSVTRFRLQLLCEPTANVQSRISLGEQVDFFGIERIVLNWHIVEDDYLKVEQFMRFFEHAVGANGIGRVQRTRYFEGEIRRKLSPGMHQMGTTRMSADPEFGVVDSNCRVYGSDNLFMAGSSVFSRVGYSNPTLTIVALADRLARHLNGAGA